MPKLWMIIMQRKKEEKLVKNNLENGVFKNKKKLLAL